MFSRLTRLTEERRGDDPLEPRPITAQKILDGGPAFVWDEPRPITARKLEDGDPLAAEWRELVEQVRKLEVQLRALEERLT